MSCQSSLACAGGRECSVFLFIVVPSVVCGSIEQRVRRIVVLCGVGLFRSSECGPAFATTEEIE